MKWSWLSFVVGLLVGWLIEWLIDYFFWRRKHRAQQSEIEDLKQQLAGAQTQLGEQEAKADECAQALEACHTQLEECLEAAQGAAQVADTRASVVVPLDLEKDAGAAEDEVDTAAFSTEEADEAEIQVGVLPPDDLDVPPETADAGPSDDEPEEPPELDEEDEAVTQDLDATRAGGVIVLPPVDEEEPPEEQDLTKIEGIGPKTSQLLNEAGIVNYAQLADTPVERLDEILDAAGSRFRLIQPGTWPQQARLAAEDKWDELKALQDRLSGGREVDESEDE